MGDNSCEGEAMDWKHLLAYITGTVDQELLLRNEYLVTEHRMLRNQITGQTPPTHPCRQWSLKPTGFFWVKLPLGRPHFSLYDMALYYIV
jgi:hypothetical protein